MVWVMSFFIGMIIGAIIMFVGLAIGREMGRREFSEYNGYQIALSDDEFGEDQKQ